MDQNLIEKYNIDIIGILYNLKNKEGKPLFQKKDIKISKKNKQLQIKCPFHNDKSPSMGINLERNQYNCFVCTNRTGELKYIKKEKSLGKGPFIYQFFQVYLEMYFDKKLEANDLFNILRIKEEDKKNFLKDINLNIKKTYSSKNKEEYKKQREELKNKKIKINKLKIYIENRKEKGFEYIVNRLNKFKEFSSEEIKKVLDLFYIGYDISTKSIVIPIFQDWYLRGLYGRLISPTSGKYININSFDKKSIIFNYDENHNKDFVYLVEGPLNVIKLNLIGIKNVISLFGASPYYEQIQKLKKYKKIIIWFDDDDGGKEGKEALKKYLPKNIELLEIKTEGKKDAYDFSKNELFSLLKNNVTKINR